MSGIEPFHLAIEDAALHDLRQRLSATRWPDRETVAGWSQGTPLDQVQALCTYWRDSYDWRRCEAMLNGFGQYRTEINGLRIHFLHIRSTRSDALPLLLTHGWPGSVIEFHKVIGRLSDPAAHGGDPSDAFHLVIPSLPGYGFSDRPASAGWGVGRIAAAWVTLMKRLGYAKFVAQGGDWGAAVTAAIGAMRPAECAAIHLNMPIVLPDLAERANWSEEEVARAAALERFRSEGSGYSALQSTRPQTLGYGLTDSPAGQAAWIYEKYCAWSDCGGDPANIFSRDEMLDNIMLYWLPACGASSARLYWESLANGLKPRSCDMPTAVSLFPKEMMRPSRRWAEKIFVNLIYWNELDRGGHFAAFEQPELFTGEMRRCFRSFRS